jgi:DNA repair exonuclease SbcCD ATPase subunit
MKLIELHMRNIFSYGNKITKIPLNFDEPILIVGENHDSMINGEFDANGAGKSSILNALLYVLYNKTLSKVKLDDLINNINKKNLYVALILENNGVYYKIERWRKNKKMGGSGNNGVRISTGESINTISTNKTPASSNVEDYIQNEILNGMPFDLAIRIMTYSAKSDSFLSLPVTSASGVSQTSILEEIFGHKVLTEVAVNLKELIKITREEIESLRELSVRISDERERYEEQLHFAEASIDKWDKDKTESIKSIKVDIAELEKIDFIEEIKQIKKLDELEKERNKAVDDSVNILSELKRQETYSKKSKEWEIKHSNDIEKVKTLASVLKDIDYDKEKSALDFIEETKSEYDEFNKIKEKLDGEIEQIINNVKKLEGEISTLKESKCPYCEQTYHDNESVIDAKVTEQRQEAELYKEKRKELEQNKNLREAAMDSIESTECRFESVSEWQESKAQFDKLSSDLQRFESEENPHTSLMLPEKEVRDMKDKMEKLDELSSLLEEQIKSMNIKYELDEIYQKQAELERLNKNLVERINEVNPHKETVEQLKKAFKGMDEVPTDKIEELESELKHQNFLLKLLTKKDSFIRQALLDANLPLLNTRLQYYLDFIGLPHKVMFTKDMTISISQFNNDIGYANLSGGQQARINLAIAFAFRDVVQARHQKINLCILDECLDLGLSNLGIKQAAKMIKDVAKENDLSMYVITHRDEIQKSFDKQLKAVLKGGLTEVELS